MIFRTVKCHFHALRLLFFKVALACCVFSFSGFNPQVKSTIQFAVQTELIDSKDDISKVCAKPHSDYYDTPEITFACESKNRFDLTELRNLNKLVLIKLKGYLHKHIFHQAMAINIPLKLPPTSIEGEPIYLSIA